jgi:diketogulonate reductase-like aldo/keto reductase
MEVVGGTMLDVVQLPGTGRLSSSLGMGTGRLMGATSLRESLALLETAFDAGIRHFDTAPSYGAGQSEDCLGAFLSRHRGEATVTTKYGIPAPRNKRVIALARGLVRPLMNQIPGFKERIQKAQRVVLNNPVGKVYSVAGARDTLDNSLRALNVDRIDLWLLHEPGLEDLHDPDLLRFMEDSVRAGKIGAFGVGSEAAKIPAIVAERPAYCPVIQCEWDPLLGKDRYPDHFTIFHNVFRNWPPKLAERFKQDSALCQSWSNQIEVNLEAPGVLDAVLLKAALIQNDGGIVLFFSKKKSNIAGNAGVASDVSLERPARTLLGLLEREAAEMFG